MNIIDYNFVPETLDWCKSHYVPPIQEYITCKVFGKLDGTDGSCHWCKEMTPYQFEMCWDESWIRGLLSPTACKHKNTREEAIEFIEEYKQNIPNKDTYTLLCEIAEVWNEEK